MPSDVKIVDYSNITPTTDTWLFGTFLDADGLLNTEETFEF